MESSEKTLNDKKEPKPSQNANIFATAIRDLRNQSLSSSAAAASSSKASAKSRAGEAFSGGRDHKLESRSQVELTGDADDLEVVPVGRRAKSGCSRTRQEDLLCRSTDVVGMPEVNLIQSQPVGAGCETAPVGKLRSEKKTKSVSVGKSDERKSKSADGQSGNWAFQSGKDDFHRPDRVRLSGSQASRFKNFADESGKTRVVSTSYYPATDCHTADRTRKTEIMQNSTAGIAEKVESRQDIRNAGENVEVKKVTSVADSCASKAGVGGFHENDKWRQKNDPYWDKSMCHNNQQRRNMNKGFQVLRPTRQDNEASKDSVLKNSKGRNQFDRRDGSNQQQQRPDKDFSTKSKSKQSKKKPSELVAKPSNDKIQNHGYNSDQRKSKSHGDSANWEPRFSKTTNVPFDGKPHHRSCDIPPRRRNNSTASTEKSGSSKSSYRNDFKKLNARQRNWNGSDDARYSSMDTRQRPWPNNARHGGTFQPGQGSQRWRSGSHGQTYVPVSFPYSKKLDSSYWPQHSDTSAVRSESDEPHGDIIHEARVFHNSRMRLKKLSSDVACGKLSFNVDHEKEMGGRGWSQRGSDRYHGYGIHGDSSGFDGGGQMANRICQSGGQLVSRDSKTPVDADYHDMPSSVAAADADTESMSGLPNEREFVKSDDHLKQQNAGRMERDKYFECETRGKTAENDPVPLSCRGSDRPENMPSCIESGFNVVREITNVDSGERNSQSVTGNSVGHSGQPPVYRTLGRGRRGRDLARPVHCDTQNAASIEMTAPDSVMDNDFVRRNIARTDSYGVSTTVSSNVVGRGRGSGRCHAYDSDVIDLCSSYSAIDLSDASRMGAPGRRDFVTSDEIHPRNDLERVQERSDAEVNDPSYRGLGNQHDLTARCRHETKTFYSDESMTTGENWSLNYYHPPPPPPSPPGDDHLVTSFSCGDLGSHGDFLYDSKEGTMKSFTNSSVAVMSGASASEATAVSLLPLTAQANSLNPVPMPQFAVCNAVTSPGGVQNAYVATFQQQCYQDMHDVSVSSCSGNSEFNSDGQKSLLASDHESELQDNTRQADIVSDPSVLRHKIPKDVYQHWLDCYFKGRDSNDECAVSWCRHYWYIYEYLPTAPKSSSSVNDDEKNVAGNCTISTNESSVTMTVTTSQVKCGEWKPFSSPVGNSDGNFDGNFCTKSEPPVKSNFVKEWAKNRYSSGSCARRGGQHLSAVSSSSKNSCSRNDRFNVLSKRPSVNLCEANSKLSFDVKSVKKFKTETVSSLAFPKVSQFEIKRGKARRASTELGKIFENVDRGCSSGEEEKAMASGFKVARKIWCPPASSLGSESASDAEGECSDWALKFRQLTEGVSTTYIDSHCHLDLLFRRTSHTGSFRDFQEANAATFPPNFAGCVTVFCNPVFWSSYESEDNLFVHLLMEDNVWAAVGCHPKSALDFNARTEMYMNHLLKHERVKAVGEIGLDFSGRYGQYRDVQIDVLTRQVTTAIRMNKPIVIHARDAESDIGEILARIVPKEYKIHRHCFLGSWSEAEAWLEKFPNSYIGMTPAVTYLKNRAALRDLLWHLPLNKILLETDAPYFVPSQLFNHEMQLSHPGLAITVAVEIAQVKNISIEDVLKSCLQNTKDMYNL